MFQVTVQMSSETQPTLSLILPLLNGLKKSMSPGPEDSGFVLKLKNAVLENLEKRYNDKVLLLFLEEATAMDPRTKQKKSVTPQVFDRLLDQLTEIKV